MNLSYSWRLSRNSAPIHGLVHHLTMKLLTALKRGHYCENYDVKREAVHSYPRNVDAVARDQRVQLKVVRCCCWNLSAFFKICFCFVFCYIITHLMTGFGRTWNYFSLEFQCFPRRASNLKVSLDFLSGNIQILEKQSLRGPVIKY